MTTGSISTGTAPILDPTEMERIHAWWRAANYLSVGQTADQDQYENHDSDEDECADQPHPAPAVSISPHHDEPPEYR